MLKSSIEFLREKGIISDYATTWHIIGIDGQNNDLVTLFSEFLMVNIESIKEEVKNELDIKKPIQQERLEELEKEYQRLYNENYNLKSQVKELEGKLALTNIDRISELKAAQMLFSIMKSGYTHEQKKRYYEAGILVLDKKINEIKSSFLQGRGLTNNEVDDLPF